MIFYQGGPIDNGTHTPVPVSQSSAEVITMQHALQERLQHISGC